MRRSHVWRFVLGAGLLASLGLSPVDAQVSPPPYLVVD
jgi:hypothetical protein